MTNPLCAMPPSRTEDKDEWVQGHSERLSEGRVQPLRAAERDGLHRRRSRRLTSPAIPFTINHGRAWPDGLGVMQQEVSVHQWTLQLITPFQEKHY